MCGALEGPKVGDKLCGDQVTVSPMQLPQDLGSSSWDLRHRRIIILGSFPEPGGATRYQV